MDPNLDLERKVNELIEERDRKKSGIVFIVLGWVFFGLSFIFIPILFGAGAFIMGFLTYRSKRQTHGVIMMVMAVVGAVLGMLIGMAVGSLL